MDPKEFEELGYIALKKRMKDLVAADPELLKVVEEEMQPGRSAGGKVRSERHRFCAPSSPLLRRTLLNLSGPALLSPPWSAARSDQAVQREDRPCHGRRCHRRPRAVQRRVRGSGRRRPAQGG